MLSPQLGDGFTCSLRPIRIIFFGGEHAPHRLTKLVAQKLRRSRPARCLCIFCRLYGAYASSPVDRGHLPWPACKGKGAPLMILPEHAQELPVDRANRPTAPSHFYNSWRAEDRIKRGEVSSSVELLSPRPEPYQAVLLRENALFLHMLDQLVGIGATELGEGGGAIQPRINVA